MRHTRLSAPPSPARHPLPRSRVCSQNLVSSLTSHFSCVEVAFPGGSFPPLLSAYPSVLGAVSPPCPQKFCLILLFFLEKKIWTCLFFSLKHELLSQSYKHMEHSTAIGGIYTVCRDQIRVISISFNILKTIWLLFNHYMFLWGSAWCFHAWMQCVLITSWYNSISVLSLCLESFSSSLPVTIKRLVGYCEGFPHPCVVLQHLKLITHVCIQVTHTHT